MSDTTNATTRTVGKRGPVAGTDEARRGGEAVRAKYGRDFFSRIGFLRSHRQEGRPRRVEAHPFRALTGVTTPYGDVERAGGVV